MSADHVYLDNEEFIVDQQIQIIQSDSDSDEFEHTEASVDELFSCKYCEFQTDNIDELDEHIVITHEEEIIHEDDEQDTRTRYYIDVAEENKVEKTVLFSNGVKRIFVCPYCGYQSMKKHDMNRHLTTHQVPAEYVMYACSECSYTTKRKCDMPKHLLKHCDVGNVPVYKCPDCTYATRRKGDLTKHSLIHKKPASTIFSCNKCSYSSKRQSELKKHRTIHDNADIVKTTADIFNCTQCGYTTTQANILHRHVVLHCDRDYKNIFKCKNCDYASVTGSHFAKHILSHCLERENHIRLTQDDPEEPQQEFVLVANETFSSHGRNEELQYKNGKLSSANFTLNRSNQTQTVVEESDSRVVVLNDEIMII